MKGDLITQMFEEMGIKVVDVTPKAKDWQFRPMRDGETFAIFTNKPSKKIPIEVWEEIKPEEPIEDAFDMASFACVNNLSISQIYNEGGKTYLVSIKE